MNPSSHYTLHEQQSHSYSQAEELDYAVPITSKKFTIQCPQHRKALKIQRPQHNDPDFIQLSKQPHNLSHPGLFQLGPTT